MTVLKGKALTGKGKELYEQINYKAPYDNTEWAEGVLYRPATSAPDLIPDSGTMDLELVPYYAWANRGLAYMDVWMPLAR